MWKPIPMGVEHTFNWYDDGQLYPTDNGLHSRKNLDADDCGISTCMLRTRENCSFVYGARPARNCHFGPRSDGSPGIEAREPRDGDDDDDDESGATAEYVDARSTERRGTANPCESGEPCGPPAVASGGDGDDRGPAGPSDAHVLRPTAESPVRSGPTDQLTNSPSARPRSGCTHDHRIARGPINSWQRCSSRIRAGSDFVASSRHATQYRQNNSRAPDAAGRRNNDDARSAQPRPAVRGRNIGGSVARPPRGPGTSVATAPKTYRVPDSGGRQSPDPPVNIAKPVQLYERSRLPVPIRPGPPPQRIPLPARLINSDWEPAAQSVPPSKHDSDRTCSFTLTGTIRLADLPAATDCTAGPPSRHSSQFLSSPSIRDNNLDSSIGSRLSSVDRSLGHERDGDDFSDLLGLGSVSENALDLTTTTRPRSGATFTDSRDNENPITH